MNRVATVFVWLHGASLALALFGLMSAVPNPAQFGGNPGAMAFFSWALVNLGSVNIWTGTLAMLFCGFAAIGAKRTLAFFAISTVLSATAELTGTATGWPFGGYEYLGFLGEKLADRVPYTVPLSWFYMGFASLLLATYAQRALGNRRGALPAIVFGALLLTAWDLVLDPAMASDKMTVMHFWVWKEHGPYFGMPLRNLAGWFGTGLVFIGLGRGIWKSFEPAGGPGIAFAVYAINVVWAMVLSVSVGLWPTAILALVAGLAPAALALRPLRPARVQPA